MRALHPHREPRHPGRRFSHDGSPYSDSSACTPASEALLTPGGRARMSRATSPVPAGLPSPWCAPAAVCFALLVAKCPFSGEIHAAAPDLFQELSVFPTAACGFVVLQECSFAWLGAMLTASKEPRIGSASRGLFPCAP